MGLLHECFYSVAQDVTRFGFCSVYRWPGRACLRLVAPQVTQVRPLNQKRTRTLNGCNSYLELFSVLRPIEEIVRVLVRGSAISVRQPHF